ncbi:hypothetical protein E4U19_000262 [Claviceps sp. Clav32 group G5]|nr:hypothetical protein E4U19_000262 [Claviceps sp. Clav32 group G5]KAG6049591.1 hypothetical protein E4U39_005844 [Claviceps sp. Clav50 group G5]
MIAAAARLRSLRTTAIKLLKTAVKAFPTSEFPIRIITIKKTQVDSDGAAQTSRPKNTA